MFYSSITDVMMGDAEAVTNRDPLQVPLSRILILLQRRPSGLGLRPCDNPNLEGASDQLVIVERGPVSADGGGLSEPGDGPDSLDMTEGPANLGAHRSIYSRIPSGGVRPCEEELQSIGGDRRRVGEHSHPVDGTEDFGAVRIGNEAVPHLVENDETGARR